MKDVIIRFSTEKEVDNFFDYMNFQGGDSFFDYLDNHCESGPRKFIYYHKKAIMIGVTDTEREVLENEEEPKEKVCKCEVCGRETWNGK